MKANTDTLAWLLIALSILVCFGLALAVHAPD